MSDRPIFERSRDGLLVSTDPTLLNLDTISAFLAASYWANTRPRAVTEQAIANSLCFGLYRDAPSAAALPQLGFARVVTDYATFAWLCDVFVSEDVRSTGLGKWLIETVVEHPDPQGLRRWMLATRDAHGLYAQFGFVPLASPDRWMERFRP